MVYYGLVSVPTLFKKSILYWVYLKLSCPFDLPTALLGHIAS